MSQQPCDQHCIHHDTTPHHSTTHSIHKHPVPEGAPQHSRPPIRNRYTSPTRGCYRTCFSSLLANFDNRGDVLAGESSVSSGDAVEDLDGHLVTRQLMLGHCEPTRAQGNRASGALSGSRRAGRKQGSTARTSNFAEGADAQVLAEAVVADALQAAGRHAESGRQALGAHDWAGSPSERC